MARAAALLVAAVLFSGCGSATKAVPRTATVCHGVKQARALAKLHRDLAVLKAAGKIHVKGKLLGSPAANHATDRFLLDLATAPISDLKRNRLIDFAARSTLANCEQCFQALEAARPLPSIAHDGTATDC